MKIYNLLNVSQNFMKLSNILTKIITTLLIFSCNTATEVKVKDAKLIPARQEDQVPLPMPPTDLKVSAYLIFDDGSISSFDVLNDKTIVLWNTIIGAGDALKASNKTKVRVTGKLDSLRVTIINGKKKVINQKLPNFSGDFEFIINNTGCEIVKVFVTKNKINIFTNTIPFHCGE